MSHAEFMRLVCGCGGAAAAAAAAAAAGLAAPAGPVGELLSPQYTIQGRQSSKGAAQHLGSRRSRLGFVCSAVVSLSRVHKYSGSKERSNVDEGRPLRQARELATCRLLPPSPHV